MIINNSMAISLWQGPAKHEHFPDLGTDYKDIFKIKPTGRSQKRYMLFAPVLKGMSIIEEYFAPLSSKIENISPLIVYSGTTF